MSKRRWWHLFRFRRGLRKAAEAIVVAAIDIPIAPPAPPPISYRMNKYSGLSPEEAAKRAPKVEVEVNDGDALIVISPRGWHKEESFATARTPYWQARQAEERRASPFAYKGTGTDDKETT